jgi:hypothetical protein
MIRYHGVFAPNFKGRKQIVPYQEKQGTVPGKSGDAEVSTSVKRERMRWAEMLKRVFEVDVTVCPKCKGRLEQIAVIKDRVVIRALLESLCEVTVFKPLKVETYRGPPEVDEYVQESFEY